MEQDQNDLASVGAPLYLFAMRQSCYFCGADVEAVVIVTKNFIDPEYDDPEAMRGEVCLLSNVVSLPEEILEIVQVRYPNYMSKWSQTMEMDYFMTVCRCGAHQGDHYVHKAFFNAACYEPETIKVEKLLLEGVWEMDCGYSTSSAYEALIDKVEV